MSEGNKIDGILKQLKVAATEAATPQPYGLHNGLTLRLFRGRGGCWELATWRQGVLPSLQEVAVLVEAIKRVDQPQIVLHSSDGELSADGRYMAYRIWWWEGAVTVSWLRPVTERLPLPDGVGRHNYQEG